MSTQQPAAGLPLLDRPLFLLDYDGTLAPIRQDPMQAYPHKEVVPLLNTLKLSYPVWIVTGRHLSDLAQLLDVQLDAIGLHGLQRGVVGQDVFAAVSERVQEDITQMRHSLPALKEARIEDKEYTFAVHYRGAEQEGVVIDALKDWLDHLPASLDAIWGKKVVELKPKGVSKGSAIKELLESFPDHQPIYIGDDTTDEAAFQTLHTVRDAQALTIKVGTGQTCAQFRLPDVSSVVAYLQRYTSV